MEYSFSPTPQLSKAESTLWYECKGLIKFLEGWCMYLITDLINWQILIDIYNLWFKMKLTTFKLFKSFFQLKHVTAHITASLLTLPRGAVTLLFLSGLQIFE